MRESTTYQAILEEGPTEGRVEQSQRFLQIVNEMTDVEQLEQTAKRTLRAASWEELFAEA